VVADEALQHLTRTVLRYDVVFADPPYGSGLLERMLPLLPRVLKPESRIYLEWGGMPPELPGGFCWLRSNRAGQVSYGLVTHLAANTRAGA
jgi:16S rRNA (guanine966-N2)-methyltransferase